jgi:serine/threonine protein kinase
MASPVPEAPQTELGQRRPTSQAAARGKPVCSGRIEDRYRSLFVVGRGGMGTVEVALEREARGFGRVVALKRLLPEGARNPRHKEMFLREARLAALLAHPNVVHAFAFGELSGELFMAMEYVEGETLSHVLRAARESHRVLEPALVASILAQVCDGLHAAHDLRNEGPKGQPLHVVHRDVSPHNVMIAYGGHVKLLDFGVAKFETGGGASETRTGEVKGKMAYMSPEQALGEKLDRRSDLFSLGALLFECLTGERMWGPGTDLEVMRRLALEKPPRLDAVMSNAPRALVDLHARLIARAPEDRPATAGDVAQELRTFATSSVTVPNTEALRELMSRLFATQTERRELLRKSLAHTAQSGVESLHPDAEAQAAVEPPSSGEELVLHLPPRRAGPAHKSRIVLVLAVLFVTLIAAAVATSAAMRRNQSTNRGTVTPRAPTAEVPPATATAISTLAATTTPTATPTATATPTPAVTANATATSATTLSMTASPSAMPAMISIPTPRGAARPRASAPQPAAPVPTKLPDVDPAPF